MNDLMEIFVGAPKDNIDATINHLGNYTLLLVSNQLTDDVTDVRGIIKNLKFRRKKSDVVGVPISTLMQTINHLRIYELLLTAMKNEDVKYVTNTIAFLIDCEQAAIIIFCKEKQNEQ